jgi:hypothetical protein
MAKICIIYEPQEVDEAEYFIGELCQDNDEVKLICKDRLPIADSMFSFLFLLSSEFDKSFVIISGRKESILSVWISSEMMIQQSMDNFTNLHPVFFTLDDIQPWWIGNEKVIILSRQRNLRSQDRQIL